MDFKKGTKKAIVITSANERALIHKYIANNVKL